MSIQQYLESIITSLPISPYNTVKTSLDSILHKCVSQLSPKLLVSQSPKDINSLILKYTHHTKIQETLRLHQLKQASLQKKELKDRLDYISQELTVLEQDHNHAQPNKQLNQSSKNIIQDQERIKFVKRVEQERKDREEKRRKDYEKFERRIEQMMVKEEIEKKEREDKLIQEKNQRVKEIHDKLEALKQRETQRKHHMKEEDITLKNVQAQVPLFRQLENSYKEEQDSFITHELKKVKDKLQPMNLDEIKQHEKKYLQSLQNKPKSDNSVQSHPVPVYYKPKAAHIIKQEEKLNKERSEHKKSERKELSEKQRLYGNIAAHIFRPSIIESTHQSSIEAVSRSPSPTRFIKKLPAIPSARKHQSLEVSLKLASKVKGANKSASISPAKMMKKLEKDLPKSLVRIDKSVDYIHKRRQWREKVGKNFISNGISSVVWDDLNMDEQLNFEDKLKAVRVRAVENEKKARRYEHLIKGDHSINTEGIEAAEAINDVYLKSIKAKMALLNSITNI